MSLIIIPNEEEQFTESKCDCDTCGNLTKAVEEWKLFKPKTFLQKRMIDVVENIEERIQKKRRIKS